MTMNMRLAGISVLLLLFGGAIAKEGPEIWFEGRKLKQRPGAQRYPVPEGGGDWEIIKGEGVKGAVSAIFREIKEPSDALKFTFGDLIYAVENILPKITTLILNSGNKMDIENTESGPSTPGLFHKFKVNSATPGIIKSGATNIDIAGSQFFIQITGISTATVEVGWLSEVSPASFKPVVNTLFEGIVEQLVDQFKSVFGGGQCVKQNLPSLYRDISGVCNNINNEYGSSDIKLKRLGAPAFGDGQSTPGGSTISARKISNIVFKEDSSSDDGSNRFGLTDMFTFFGQFVDHDIGISPVGSFASQSQPLFSTSFEKFLVELPISVPEDDPDFVGQDELPFERAVFLREDNKEVLPRQILNELTSFLDLSMVYGSTASRARALRSFSNGKMKTSQTNFLPFNGGGPGGIGISLDNAEDASNRFYVGGDIRANENVNLLALHIIWLREHNKIADELKAANPSYTDEELYELARAINIAQYQSILYTEWLPLLLGDKDTPNPGAFSYNAGIDASADIFFTTVSFRFGHTMINGKLWRVDKGSTTPSTLADLRDVFFTPEALTPGNMDTWVRGMVWHEAREADEKVHDDLRTFLFTKDGGPHMDLVALNIQRARDMGLPTYNEARKIFGLPAATSFSDISDRPETVENLELAYEGDVDAVDAFAGGLSEPLQTDRLFGDLFHASLKEQFERLRDGDRFFYKDQDFELIQSEYPRALDIQQDKIKFIDILNRNTGVSKSDLGGRASPFQL